MNKNHIIISFLLLLVIPMVVNAETTANVTWEGEDLIKADAELKLDLTFKNIQGADLVSAGGIVEIEDENCFQIIKVDPKSPFAGYESKSKKFAYTNVMGANENFTMVQVTLKGSKNTCSTTIKVKSPKLAFSDSTNLSPSDIEKKIGVVNYDELKINQSNLKLTVKETYQLQIYVPNAIVINPNLITWTTDNNKIASVDNTGKVTGVGVGSTTIRANYSGRNYTSKVSVINFLKGDLNKDGRISGADVTVGMRIYLGLIESNSEYVMIGDINNNNRIDSGDITYILRTYLGLTN